MKTHILFAIIALLGAAGLAPTATAVTGDPCGDDGPAVHVTLAAVAGVVNGGEANLCTYVPTTRVNAAGDTTSYGVAFTGPTVTGTFMATFIVTDAIGCTFGAPTTVTNSMGGGVQASRVWPVAFSAKTCKAVLAATMQAGTLSTTFFNVVLPISMSVADDSAQVTAADGAQLPQAWWPLAIATMILAISLIGDKKNWGLVGFAGLWFLAASIASPFRTVMTSSQALASSAFVALFGLVVILYATFEIWDAKTGGREGRLARKEDAA